MVNAGALLAPGPVYIDASAVVALFAGEARGRSVRAWLDDAVRTPLISADWCITEVASALSLKVRTRQLSPELADEAWTHFDEACDGLVTLVPVEPPDFVSAAQMCREPETQLRSGDALHLAVALRIGCAALLCFDDTLNQNAQAHGLAVISP
jgi:predicted nucleic acid-binding protein